MPQFKDDRFDPSKAACPKLWCHITQKGIQGGAVLGTFAVAPALGLYQHFVKKEQVDPLKIAEGVALTTLGSLGLTFLVGSVKLLQMDREGMEDRVYRLHYNTSQHRNDHLSQVGGALGLAAAAYFLRNSSDAKPVHYVGGASAGAAAGILLHMLTRPQEAKSVNKMLHELVN
ncbi:hypothetical protein OEZ85_011218 [Tetradesmus obliquus]|uniref:Uncharacterized protein n=1 Tax=Tetradesmus obliquus TaxID=3088 RepID=A0ABY8TPL7_TETOB|nr:hypothetical protein OEZ85_011218 [Tetradesmus obliquus]